MLIKKISIPALVFLLLPNHLYAAKLFNVPGDQVQGGYVSKTLEPKKDYLTITVKSMQLDSTTIGFKKYYASINSKFTFASNKLGQKIEFETITKPSKLLEDHGRHQDRIAQFNQKILGPVPYAGENFDLSIGLLSVKSIDLSEPYLKLLGEIGDKAGVSIINQALPFIPLIKEGVATVTGTDGSSKLQAAYESSWKSIATGYYVIIKDKKAASWNDQNNKPDNDPGIIFGKRNKQYALKDLKIVPDTNVPHDVVLADKDGKHIEDISYVILLIEGEDKRTDFASLKEINDAYVTTFDLLNSKKFAESDASLLHLFNEIRKSWDIHQGDKARLIREMQKYYDDSKSLLFAPGTFNLKPRKLNSFE